MKPIEFSSEYTLIAYCIMDNKNITVKQLIEKCLERNPNSKVNAKSIYWYKTRLRRDGMKIDLKYNPWNKGKREHDKV